MSPFPTATRLRPLLRLAGACLAALSLFGTAGCGEDEPAECGRALEGEFQFESDPPETTRFTGTLETATHYLGGDHPLWEYIFHTNGNHTVQLLVVEVGPSVLVSEGSVYTMEVVTGGTDPHESFGIRVEDAQGLRYMAVADWRPEYSIFVPGATQQGYLLQGTERMVVAVSDPGCAPIEENTEDYRMYRNRRLRFAIPGGPSAELYNGQSATLGNWVVHVHKAMEIVPKLPTGIQNQLSFSVERAGLRS